MWSKCLQFPSVSKDRTCLLTTQPQKGGLVASCVKKKKKTLMEKASQLTYLF